VSASVAIAAAWAADRRFGDPTRFHPVAGFGRAAARLEQALWRPSRIAGAVHAALLVGSLAAAAARVERGLAARPRARFAFRAAAIWATLGGRSLEHAARALARAVEAGDLERARSLAPVLVGRDPSGLDGTELSRAAVESVAENTSDAVVAPLVWTALLGITGAVAYRAVNTLDAMVGRRDERYTRFGWAAARLDDVVNWPAARLTALLTVAAAPLVGGRPAAAWRAAWHDGAAHPSPNAGRVEGAFAGALGIRLGGTNRYGSRLERRPHLGEGPAATPDDVLRAVRLARVVGGSAAALAVLLAWRLGR
jgi:adenosylcobinamide-phosphate synthase